MNNKKRTEDYVKINYISICICCEAEFKATTAKKMEPKNFMWLK